MEEGTGTSSTMGEGRTLLPRAFSRASTSTVRVPKGEPPLRRKKWKLGLFIPRVFRTKIVTLKGFLLLIRHPPGGRRDSRLSLGVGSSGKKDPPLLAPRRTSPGRGSFISVS